MEEHRIPPAVSFRFEQIIAQAAEHAGLEPTEWAIRSHELMSQLEHRWREGIDMGLSTDAAEQRAIELFGDPAAVGRRYQKPMEINLLYSRAWQAARILLFLITSTITLGRIELEFAFANARQAMIRVTRDLDANLRDMDKTYKTNRSPKQKPASGMSAPAVFVPNFKERVALWLKPLTGALNLHSWVAAIAPWLIVWISRRSGTARFGHPLSQVLLGIVLSCVAWVTGAELVFQLWELVFAFKVTAIPGIVFAIAFTCVGSLCLVAETIDLPSKRKWRILRLLGYKT